MKTSTKLIAIGAGFGLGAAALGATHLFRKRARAKNVDSLFDASDVHDINEIADASDVEEPIVITEEIIVISEPR